MMVLQGGATVFFAVVCLLGLSAGQRCNPSCQTLLLYRARGRTTLAEVASAFNAPANLIRSINNGSVLRHVMPGQEIMVPGRCTCNQQRKQTVTLRYIVTDNTTSMDSIASVAYGDLPEAAVMAESVALRAMNATELYLNLGQHLSVQIPCACSSSVAHVSPVLYMTYRVQPGDTLLSVAARFNADPQAMQFINSLMTPLSFDPGLLVEVPVPACLHKPSGRLFPLGSSIVIARGCIECQCSVGDSKLECAATELCPNTTCPRTDVVIGSITNSSTCPGQKCRCDFVEYNSKNDSVVSRLSCWGRRCTGMHHRKQLPQAGKAQRAHPKRTNRGISREIYVPSAPDAFMPPSQP